MLLTVYCCSNKTDRRDIVMPKAKYDEIYLELKRDARKMASFKEQTYTADTFFLDWEDDDDMDNPDD